MARFDIIYQDDEILVVDKPAGLLTVPHPEQQLPNLLELLEKALNLPAKRKKLWVVHRLDRDTSGVLVFAKNSYSCEALCKDFASHKSDRKYLALVKGTPKPLSGTIKSYLATGDNLTRYSTRDKTKGELAITHYETLTTRPGVSLVELTLETGQRNQIRVHLAELGNPIIGDRRYGRQAASADGWPRGRLALHAASLGITHPDTGEDLVFEAPIPTEFRGFLRGRSVLKPELPPSVRRAREDRRKKPRFGTDRASRRGPAPRVNH